MMWLVAIVKAALSWPVAAVIIALAYKPDLLKTLPNFLSRRMKLEGFGIKAEIDTAEQQQAAAENPAEEKLPQQQALDPSPRAAINIMEARLRNELSTIDAPKKEAVLVRALADTRLTSGHEFTYNRIFGSQILALRRLNSVGRATIEHTKELYAPLPERFPQIYANYGFDGWLGFLKNSGLIVEDGEFLSVTDIGRDFLFYLTDKRLFEGKPG